MTKNPAYTAEPAAASGPTTGGAVTGLKTDESIVRSRDAELFIYG